jgi:hypothetical protein
MHVGNGIERAGRPANAARDSELSGARLLCEREAAREHEDACGA